MPVGVYADWYARGVARGRQHAAARKTNEIPAGRPSIEKAIFRPAGISHHSTNIGSTTKVTKRSPTVRATAAWPHR
jgi:hypothetical protein